MERYKIAPDSGIRLSDFDPRDAAEFSGGKKEARAQLKALNGQLEVLQELLYAEGRQKLLIVLQGMDTSGKDGTIRHVFEGVNPQGVKVAGFGKPTAEELAHDYLWRIHKRVPKRGEITIFNRSHYEDVLVVRVHALVPPEQSERRYRHMVEFERMLHEEGVTIRKFFLHISKEEQKARLQERLDRPEKNWKFNRGDLRERARWEDYTAAYEAVLNRTSTDFAPWYVVPADRKWYRNLVVATVMVETLKGLDMAFPEPEEDLGGITIE